MADTDDRVELTDLDVIARYSLAVRAATADRHELIATLRADLEHVIPASQGGQTIQENLTYEVRRWHTLKTHGGWTVQRHRRGWKWTSPRGRTYYTQPYDYRLGP